MYRGERQSSLSKRVRRAFRPVRRFLLACAEVPLVLVAAYTVPYMSRRMELRLAHGVGWLKRVCSGRGRRIVMANLNVVYGSTKTEAEKVRIMCEFYEHMALVLLDYFWFLRKTAERISLYCSAGDEIVESWITGRSPGFLVTAHIGNWELGGQYIAWRGRSISSVYSPIGTKATLNTLLKFRKATGQHVIPRVGAVSGMMRVLRSGGIVAMLLDQHTELTDGGIYLDFFGLPATFSNAVGLIAHRQAVPVCTICIRYDKATDRYTIKSYGLVTADESKALAPEQITERIARDTERMILDNPSQWLWEYRRWKRYRAEDDRERFPWYAALDTCIETRAAKAR